MVGFIVLSGGCIASDVDTSASEMAPDTSGGEVADLKGIDLVMSDDLSGSV